MKLIAKALVAGALAGLAAVAVALRADGSLDALDWVLVVSAALATGYGTWQTPNAQPEIEE